MATWRRKTLPACPACDRPSGPAFHSKTDAGLRCGGELYVDIEDGTTRCRGCSDRTSLEEFTHNCSCGCRYVGGEVWQGMRSDLTVAGNKAWMRRVGITKGKLETRIIKQPPGYQAVVVRENPYLVGIPTTDKSTSTDGPLGCSGYVLGLFLSPFFLYEFLADEVGGFAKLWIFSLLCSLIGIVYLFGT